MDDVARTAPLFAMERLQCLMEENDIDAIVAHSRRHYYYLSSFASLDYVIDARSRNFVLIPRSDDCPAITSIPTWESIHLRDAPIWVPRKIFAGNFYVKDAPQADGPILANMWEALVEMLSETGLGDGRVAFELDQLSVQLYDQLVAAFPHMKIVDASPTLHRLRMIKTQEEARRIRVACEITEEATNEAAFNLHAGMTERDLARNIAEGIVSRGADVLYVQVATGKAAGLHLPTERHIAKGDIIRADIAAVFNGYNSDLGRTYVVGPPTSAQSEIYHVAYAALQAGIEAVRVGSVARDIFEAAMAVWTEAGYTHVRRHHVGHGIGLEAHEAPVLKPDNETPIEAGMVLAVEVPYYIYGLGGFAPEDILMVEPEGNVLFSRVAAELPVVEQF
jgi:Xaa-Pro dipeptidase